MRFYPEEVEAILTAADCSEAVYLPFDSAAFEVWASGFEFVRTWVAGNCEGMGVVRNGIAYIAFRGTEPAKIKDWMSDLTARPEPFPRFGSNAFVHAGFESYAMAIEEHVRNYVRAVEGRVVICGHSLGGAAAVLSAAMLSDKIRLPEVVTFGAPPAGSRDFVRSYNQLLGSRTYRFEHGTDLVPVLPGILPWLRHVGPRMYLPNIRKTVWIDPGQVRYRADRLLGYIPAVIKYSNPLRLVAGIAGEMVADHGLGRYRKHLSAALKTATKQQPLE